MKKFATLFIALMVMLSLTACGDERILDYDYAYAEITTSSGDAQLAQSANATSRNYHYSSGISAALDRQTQVYVPTSDEVVTIHFVCEQCSHDETEELSAPAAKVYSCNCKEADHEEFDGNAKEYLAITVVVGEEPKETEETEA